MKHLTILTLLASFLLLSCSNPKDPNLQNELQELDSNQSPTTLINLTINEFEDIHEWTIAGKPMGKENALLKTNSTNADSIWIYGIEKNGIGMVVTEKHTYPKGLLLITKNYKYGIVRYEIKNGVVVNYTPALVSITEKFISWQQYNQNKPETKTIVELYPDSTGAIISHVTKYVKDRMMKETYTFKQPIITVDRSKNLRIVKKGDINRDGIATLYFDDTTDRLLKKRTTGVNAEYNGAFFTETTELEPDQNNNLKIVKWIKTTVLGLSSGRILKFIERFP